MAEEVKKTTHADNADPLTPPNVTHQTPGRLMGGARMELHTRPAHRLFYGRRKTEVDGVTLRPIIGLIKFAFDVGKVWNAAMMDDPFADWILLDVERQLEKANESIEQHIAHLQSLIDGVGGIEFDVQESITPVTIPMSFYTPYGFMAARILVAYDDMVRLALTARHVGLIFEDDWDNCVHACGKAIRRAFSCAERWRYTSVVRDDLAANNAVARRALDIYSEQRKNKIELPEDVLTGERRAKVRPPIKKKESVLATANDTVDESALENCANATTVDPSNMEQIDNGENAGFAGEHESAGSKPLEDGAMPGGDVSGEGEAGDDENG